jgi:PAS domain S-box-containing protein
VNKTEVLKQLAAQREALERKNAELEAANKTLLIWAKVQESINDALLVTEAEPIDAPGPRILYVNPAFERMTGYTAAEVVGQTPRILQGEKTDRRELDRIHAALEKQEPVHVELTNYRKDGTEFEVEFEIVPARDEAGRVTHLISIQRDVTERKQVDRALQESEARYRTLFEQAIVGIAHTDHDGNFLTVNDQFCRITGRDRSTLLRLRLQDITYPDDRPAHLERFRQLMADGAPFMIETRYTRADGSLTWVRNHISSVRNANDHTEYIAIITEDTTEPKVAQRALQQSEAQLAGIIGSAMDAIICVDEAQRIVLFNAAAEQMFLCPVADAMGQPLTRFIPERFRRTHAELIRTFGRTGITTRTMSALTPVFGLRAGGEEFPIEASISQIEIAGNRLYTVIIRDITERKRAEQTAQKQTAALIQTLKSLKKSPDLDLFLKQVLMTLSKCLNAAAAALWLYDQEQERFTLYLNYDEGHDFTESLRDHLGLTQRSSAQENPYWIELVRTRLPLSLDASNLPEREWYFEHGIRGVLLVPLLLGDDVLGCVSVRSTAPADYRPAELELAQALTQQAALAIQMSRLAEQGQQTAILQERNRMAQEIHDTLAQGFTGILLQLEAAAYAPEQEQARVHIEQSRKLARQSLQEAQRSVRALRPQALEGDQLPGALAHLVTQVSSTVEMIVSLQIHGTPYPLPVEVENHLLRIAQEALTNAVRHSEGASVLVELTFEPAQVRLCIHDDGVGFEPSKGVEKNGFGLIGMYERAEQIGGRMTLATHPGRGTTITAAIPTQPRKS